MNDGNTRKRSTRSGAPKPTNEAESQRTRRHTDAQARAASGNEAEAEVRPDTEAIAVDWPEGYPEKSRQIIEGLMKAGRERGFKGDFLYFYLALKTNTYHTDVELRPLTVWTTLKTWGDFGGYEKGVPLPEWCLKHLHEIAGGIQQLRADTNRSPDVRLKSLAGVMGFSRPSWNIFDADRRNLENAAAALVFNDAKDKGEKTAEALERVMTLLDLTDERSARRQIAKGKASLTDLPGQNPPVGSDITTTTRPKR
jgi:hypothetical protein